MSEETTKTTTDTSTKPADTSASVNQSSGLDENVAAAISYIFIVGLIFIFIEKNSKFVRFHAIQSVLVSVIFGIFSLIPFVNIFTGLAALIILIFGAYKAYNKEMYKFPFVGNIAEKQANNLPQ